LAIDDFFSNLFLLVGKKKDPNRFGPKEFADAIEPVEDSGWAQSAPGKGSGWGNSLETWEDSDKWGTEDRQWGDKEGTWEKPVVEGGDKDTWPTVGSKGAIGDKLKTSSSEAGSEKGQYSANSSPKTSVSSMSAALKSDNPAQGNVTSNVDKKSLPSNNWQGAYPAPTENWDVIDESIDQAIDAADAATAKDNAGLAAGWGGVAKGGLGGLIGNSSNWELKDSSSSVHSQESGKCELANNSSVSEAPSWSKTPGKGFKTKLPTTSTAVTSNITTSWGGTPAETNTKWTEPNSSSEGVTNSKSNKPPLLDSTSIAKSAAENKSEPSVTPNSSTKLSASGWDEAPASNPSNWGNSAEITGAACWDSVMSKSDSSELKAASNSKVSQWLESTGMSLADFEWGQENMEHEEGSEGSLDGWTTASKRNRVRTANCYFLIHTIWHEILSLRVLIRPFQSCLLPLCLNESWRINWKFVSPGSMFFFVPFSYTRFCMKILLQQRRGVTRKWPILRFLRVFFMICKIKSP